MKWLSVLVVLIMASAGVYLAYEHWQTNRATPASSNKVVPSETPTTPTVQHPIPTETTPPVSVLDGEPPAPTLDESDQTIEKVLVSLLGSEAVSKYINLDAVIRRIVVTIENARGNRQVSDEASFLKPMETTFQVSAKGAEQTIAVANSQRYAPYVALLRKLDMQKLAAAYIHFYPLFQTAYSELGTPGNFNDHVIELIDSALKTPEPRGALKVARPSAPYRYKFVDERLEALPVIQKALLRMGVENTRVVKEKLRQLRKQLVRAPKS